VTTLFLTLSLKILTKISIIKVNVNFVEIFAQIYSIITNNNDQKDTFLHKKDPDPCLEKLRIRIHNTD